MNDWELLDSFRSERSQSAFAELVRRHAGFVWSTCRRQLRVAGAHLADDVTQAVFLVLSRRPPARSGQATLAGWLYRTSVYACRNAIRAELARQRHEREAAEQRTPMSSSAQQSNSSSVEVEANLDEAMADLSERDRDVLLLRYYQDMDLAQVGATLGISQNTAGKRLSRALDRLRRALADRGTHIASAVVGEALVRATRDPAPTGLVSKLSSAGLGDASASEASRHIAEGVIRMIRRAQMNFVATLAFTAVLLIGGVTALSLLLVTHKTSPDVANAAPPATAPAKLTPKEALLAFADAVASGDHARMRSLAYTNEASETALLDAAREFAAAQVALRQSVAKAYGEPVAKQLDAQLSQFPLGAYVQAIKSGVKEAAEIQDGADGKTVTVRAKGEPPIDFCMIDDNGAWKIHAGRMIADWTPDVRVQRTAFLSGVATVVKSLADDIDSGKYPTIQEFAPAMQKALRQFHGG